ncbi:MAG: molybdopterin-dependent oxidoreductase [Clostridia bacterium]|nr:molybdopterin-dependent oxidoreductase [Clostridia bacterium]
MSEFNIIGKRVPQKDAVEKSTGAAQYVTDLKLPGMLYGKILRSPYPHASILCIDTTRAKRLPGVKSVITFSDTPQIKFGPLVDDWYILAKDKVRFIGEEVAAVAAVDEDTAREAIELIRVEYEELPAVFTPGEAIQPGAPIINPEYPNNVVSHFKVERGDVEQAFREADLVIGDEFYANQVYQAYMESMACIAQSDGRGHLTLWLPSQVPSKTRMSYAKALGIQPRDIRVIRPHVGGGFGAKMEYDADLICALLATNTGRPVKIVNTRMEDFEAGNPRVPMSFDLRLAFKKDGTLLAKDLKALAGNGGRTVYGPAIMSTACYRIDSLYRIPNLRADGRLVYTNTVPTACFRGFGNAQATFALESLLDMAAHELGIEPAELRIKNSFNNGDTSPHGWFISTSGLADTIEQATQAAGWNDKKRNKTTRRGIGLACTNHVSGNRGFYRPFDGSSAILRVGESGQAVLIQGEAEIGQGQNTVYAMLAAEAAGLRYEDVTVAQVDTLIGPFGLGSFASRGTVLGGQAVIAAGKDAKRKLLAEASSMFNIPVEKLDIREGVVCRLPEQTKMATVAEVASHYMFRQGGCPLTGEGVYVPDTVVPDPVTKIGNISPVYCFATHIAEVEVDTETGQVKVLNYFASHDVGKILNPVGLEGQVEGGVVQGLGWALMEDMVTVNGKVQNPTFLDYRIPGVRDIGKIHVSFVETNDPKGPYGAKGIGEPALNPVTAAVANAIYDAVGVRIKSLPITPEKILAALEHTCML